MSTSNLGKKILWLFLVVFTVNLIINLFRQLYKFKMLGTRLKQREEYQKKLVLDSLNLGKQLELVQSPQYIKEQSAKLLGERTIFSEDQKSDLVAVDQLLTAPRPNYQKWFDLFFKKAEK